jgi:hypothetical protein
MRNLQTPMRSLLQTDVVKSRYAYLGTHAGAVHPGAAHYGVCHPLELQVGGGDPCSRPPAVRCYAAYGVQRIGASLASES